MRRIRYGAAALVTAAFLMSGCGGGDDALSSSSLDSAPYGVGAPAAAAPQRAPAGGVAAEKARPAQQPGGKIAIEPAQRSIVYTAELTVRVKDVAAAVDQAKVMVTGAGGYVAEEKSTSSSAGAQAVLAFKIPPTGYPDMLARLGRELGKSTSVHQNASDVTEEVADVDSRVKSARTTLDQFRTLLSKATKIGEVLEIEREISSREADLEALQARQKALAAQTGMATVTLTITPAPRDARPKKEEPSGFLAGLREGWEALVTSTRMALTMLGILLPWLVPAAVVWVAVVAIRRRIRPRRTVPPMGMPGPQGSGPYPSGGPHHGGDSEHVSQHGGQADPPTPG